MRNGNTSLYTLLQKRAGKLPAFFEPFQKGTEDKFLQPVSKSDLPSVPELPDSDAEKGFLKVVF